MIPGLQQAIYMDGIWVYSHMMAACRTSSMWCCRCSGGNQNVRNSTVSECWPRQAARAITLTTSVIPTKLLRSGCSSIAPVLCIHPLLLLCATVFAICRLHHSRMTNSFTAVVAVFARPIYPARRIWGLCARAGDMLPGNANLHYRRIRTYDGT